MEEQKRLSSSIIRETTSPANTVLMLRTCPHDVRSCICIRDVYGLVERSSATVMLRGSGDGPSFLFEQGYAAFRGK